MHEITHILVLNPTFYSEYFVSSSSNIKRLRDAVVTAPASNSARLMIITETVLAYVQSHFGCSDGVTGGMLEEEGIILFILGGSGSASAHWERKIYLDEMMTASVWSTGLKIGEVTLSLFKDSGFYEEVDMTKL